MARTTHASIISSLAIVALVVAGAWAVARIIGYDFALWSSLVLSLALAAVLWFGMRLFSRSRRVHRAP
jgi:hypothetical protein